MAAERYSEVASAASQQNSHFQKFCLFLDIDSRSCELELFRLITYSFYWYRCYLLIIFWMTTIFYLKLFFKFTIWKWRFVVILLSIWLKVTFRFFSAIFFIFIGTRAFFKKVFLYLIIVILFYTNTLVLTYPPTNTWTYHLNFVIRTIVKFNKS